MNDFTDQITKLDNGVTIVTRHMPQSRRVAFQVVVQAGNEFERKDQHGYAHFVEHVLPTQTRKYSSKHEIYGAFDSLGFNKFNLATNYHFMLCPYGNSMGDIYYCSSSVFPDALEIVLNVIGHPLFPPEGVEGERRRILEEIATAKKDIFRRNRLHWLATFLPDTCFARNVLGNEETVSSAQAEGLKTFWERNYVGNKIFIFASGNMDPDKTVKQAESFLGHLPEGVEHVPSILTPKLSEVRIPDNDTEQIQMELMWPGAHESSPQIPNLILTTVVLNETLDSELLNKKQLVYSIRACLGNYRNAGTLSIEGNFHWNKQDKILESIQECLAILAHNPPQDIINTFKKRNKVFWDAYEPSTTEQAERLRNEYFTHRKLLSDQENLDLYMKPTAEDVMAMARSILLKTPVSLFINGPVDRFPSREEVDFRIRKSGGVASNTPSRSAQPVP